MTNTNSKPIFGFIAGALIGGFAVSFLTNPKASPSDTGAGLVPESQALSNGAIEPKQDTPQLVSTTQDVSRTVAKARPAALQQVQVPDAEVVQWMDSVGESTATEMTGDGVIHGSVLDLDGQPIAGVVLRLVANQAGLGGIRPGSVGSAAPEIGTLEEAIRATAENYHSRRVNTRQLQTDAAGLFRFEGLADATWRLKAFREGYLLKAPMYLGRLPLGTEVAFTAEPVVEISVSVFGANGQLAESATIQVKGTSKNARPSSYVWSPEEAFVRVPIGMHKIAAFSSSVGFGREAALASEWQDVRTAREGEGQKLRFDLVGRLGVKGFVRLDKSERQSERMYVRCLALGEEQELDLALLKDSGLRQGVQPGAEYSFQDLEPGRYAVGVARGWNSEIVHSQVVEILSGPVRCDLDVPALDLKQVLRVAVVGTDGLPVEDVMFQFVEQSETDSNTDRLQSTQDSDRTYLLLLEKESHNRYFGSNASGSQFQVIAHQETYGSQTVDLVQGQTDATIVFIPPGSLEVTIRGYQGSGYEGRLRITTTKEGADPQTSLYVPRGEVGVSPAGVQVIPKLSPGSYTIGLTVLPEGAEARWYRARTVDTLNIKIQSGLNRTRIAIPTLYSLRVHWADGKEGATMSLKGLSVEDPNSQFMTETLDADGFVEWSDLQAGTYRVRATGGHLEVTVPCGVVEFVPTILNALRVKITDAKGGLAIVGFQEGDLVVGVDGVEFSGRANRSLLGQLTSSKAAEVQFLVLRGSESFDLTVKGSEVGDKESLGGRLIPVAH